MSSRYRRVRLGTAVGVLAIVSALLAPTAGAQSVPASKPLVARVGASKSLAASQRATDPANRRVVVKFAEGTGVRLRGGQFVTTAKVDLSGLSAVLARYPGLTLERLFERPESPAGPGEGTAGGRLPAPAGRPQPLLPPRRARAPTSSALIAALNDLDVVELAYSEPRPVPPPVTPDFTGQPGVPRNGAGRHRRQLRRDPAGRQGPEHHHRRHRVQLERQPRGPGQGPAGALIANGTPDDPFDDNNHGTAVLGEIVGDENALRRHRHRQRGRPASGQRQHRHGATTWPTPSTWPLPPSAQATSSSSSSRPPARTAAATPRSRSAARRSSGCRPSTTPSWRPPPPASSSWRPAGNGTQDLDAAAVRARSRTAGPTPAPSSWAPAARAGCTNPARGAARLLQLRGPGRTSRAGASAWSPPATATSRAASTNASYTAGFGGTSSASPIVAGAAGVVSSVIAAAGVHTRPHSRSARILLRRPARPSSSGSPATSARCPTCSGRSGRRAADASPGHDHRRVAGVITLGTPGDDVILGTTGTDRIAGIGGNDIIIGGGGRRPAPGRRRQRRPLRRRRPRPPDRRRRQRLPPGRRRERRPHRRAGERRPRRWSRRRPGRRGTTARTPAHLAASWVTRLHPLPTAT